MIDQCEVASIVSRTKKGLLGLLRGRHVRNTYPMQWWRMALEVCAYTFPAAGRCIRP